MLQVANLKLGYQQRPVLRGVTADIPQGALVAVVGPNGAGKSTLIKAIQGQLKPQAGELALRLKRCKTAYLPQQSTLDLSFPISVAELVSMGYWRSKGPFSRFSAQNRARISSVLKRVGLDGLEQRPVSMLSGGQRQRMLFARMMLQDANFLLLDEPFTAIDQQTTEDLMGLIQHWQQQGKTIIAVLHNIALVAHYFPYTWLVDEGTARFADTPTVLDYYSQHSLAGLEPCVHHMAPAAAEGGG